MLEEQMLNEDKAKKSKKHVHFGLRKLRNIGHKSSLKMKPLFAKMKTMKKEDSSQRKKERTQSLLNGIHVKFEESKRHSITGNE